MADDQKVLKKRLKVLMNLPQNQVCSDCSERQPRWASLIVAPPGAPPGSLPIGAFCCLECSGSHRRLGVHIAFVRSINLDSWKEKEVLSMENGGNGKVNAIFEASLPNASVKPTNRADGPTRERFIRDKYERRKYYDPSGFTDYASTVAASSSDQRSSSSSSSSQQHAPRSGNSGASPQVQVGPPSDAAKQRLEQRRARINGNRSSSSVEQHGSHTSEAATVPRRSNKGAVAKAPASAPPPSSVDLLDLMGGGEESSPAIPVTSEPPKQQQQQQQGGGLDLFDFLTADKQWEMQQQQATDATFMAQASSPPPPQQQKQPALDIMALYNGVQQPQQQQQSFANFGFMHQQQQQQQHQHQKQPMMNGVHQMNGVGNGMPNNNMMMMMNSSGGTNNGIHQMTNSMQNMRFQQQPQQMTHQQLQQQQLYQQQMLMMQQQQQQQQQMMMTNNMHGGGGGGGNTMHQSGMMQQQQHPKGFGASRNAFQMSSKQAAATPEKEDPFAQFGSNVFRS